jgi:hypothetical protein
MATVALDVEQLRDLLGQRDALVRALATGAASGNWDPVMPAFDGLLLAIARLEERLGRVEDG